MTFIDSEDDNPFQIKKREPDLATPISAIDPDPFKKLRANSNLVGNRDADPDEAGKTLRLAQEHKTAPELIEVDRKTWDAHLTNEKNVAISNNNPTIQSYLANNPMASRVSKDDLGILDSITRLIDGSWAAHKEFNPGVKALSDSLAVSKTDNTVAGELIRTAQPSLWIEAGKEGFAAYQYGQLLERYRLGDEATRQQLDPLIKAYQAEQAGKPESGVNAVQRLFGGFVGQFLASTPEVAQYGTYGAITGATAGAISPVPGGAAAGMILGGAGGLAYGFAITMGSQTAGHVYYAVKDIEGLSEQTKQMLAFSGGLVVGTLGAHGGAMFQAGVSQLIKQFAADKAGQAMLSQFAAVAAKYSAEGAVINGGQVFSELLMEQIGKTLGTRDLKTVFNDREEAEKFGKEVLHGMVAGAAIGGPLSLLHLTPGRGTRMGDTIISGKTLADANRLDEVMRMAQESKTKERFPGMFAAALKEGHDKTLFIDPQIVRENKNVFSFIDDLDGQLATNAALGTEIKVQMSDFVAHMPPEIYALMRDKVRQGGDALTPAEAQAIQLAMQKADEQLALKAQQAAGAELAAPPPAEAVPMSRDAAIAAIASEQPSPTPEATPRAPATIQIPGVPPVTIPPEIAVQGRSLFDRLLGRRVTPTPEQLTAQIVAENEARIRAGIKPPPPEETPIRQAEASPQPEAISTAAPIVTETTPGRITESPPAEAIKPVVDADKVVKKEVEIGVEGRQTLLEELKALAERAPAKDVPEAILLNALRRNPGNLAELRTFIDDGARFIGVDPKETHARAEAAVAALSTKLIKEETSAVVLGLTDPNAKSAAFATGQMIDSTRHIQWLTPLFDGSELGAAGRAAYNEHLLEVQRALTESVFDAAREVVERKATKLWKNQMAEMKPEVQKDIAAKPVIMADEFFRTGDAVGLGEQKLVAKLDRKEIDTMFTPDELRAMGVKGKKLSLNKLLTTNMFGKGDSVMPADLLATAFGYKDGKTMMRELVEFRQSLKDTNETPKVRFDRLVNEEVNGRMVAEHGRLDQIIEENALKAAHHIAQDKVFGDELKALSKLSGKELMKHEDVKKIVDDSMQEMKNLDAGDIERYKTLAGKHGRQAQILKDAGDYEGALNSKQEQVKASLMARNAVEIARQARQTANIVSRFADKPRIEAMSPEFNTRALQLIQATGLEIRGRTAETLARDIEATGQPSYSTWAQERKDRYGEAVPTLSSLNRGEPPVGNIMEMSVANTRELHQALKTLEQLGKTDDTVRLGNKVITIDELNRDIKAQLTGIDARHPESIVPEYNIRKTLQAELLKMETVARKGDRGEVMGLLSRATIGPIKLAQDAHWLLRRKVADFLRDVDHGEWRFGMNKLNDAVPNETMLDKRGRPHDLNRGNMLMVALNWGTEQGRSLMANTLNSDSMTVQAWLMKNMTKKNWDFVENIWRMYDNIIVPEMDKVYRSQRGFGMETPDAIRFLDGFSNPRQGGYFPLIRRRDGALPAMKETVVFDNRLYDSLPSQSHKEALRSGEFPLSLDFNQLPYRIGEQIHSIAYREAVRDVSKLIDSREFQTTMTEAFGREQAGLWKPWIRDVANDGGRYDNSVAHGWQWIFRSLLRNAVQTFTGFNLATAAIHSPSAATNTIGELRFRTFRAIGDAIGDSQLVGLARKMVSSPENADKYADFAWKNSVELRSRWKSSENDIRKSLGQWGKLESLNYYAEWWGQSMISYTDYMTATVAWHGGYRKAIAEGLSHEEAVARGDALVRAAHGSMAIADKSQFNRERNTQQFAAFYGFFNHVMNQTHLAGFEVRDAYRKAVNEKSYTEMGKQLNSALWKGMSSMFFYAVMQSFIHDAVRGDHKQDEHWGKRWADELMGFGAGFIPGVREAGFAVGHAWSIASIPTTALLDIPRRWWRDTKKWVNDGGKFPLRTSIELSGAAGFRGGARSIARWGEEMQNIMNGTTPPPSDFHEWKRLFIYGHSNPVGTRKGSGNDPLGLGSGSGRNANRTTQNPLGSERAGKRTTKNPLGY